MDNPSESSQELTVELRQFLSKSISIAITVAVKALIEKYNLPEKEALDICLTKFRETLKEIESDFAEQK